MVFNKVALSIHESPTFSLNEQARLLQLRGEPVINLSIGEPQNKAPIAAILSSTAKLASGEIKYTPPDGVLSLKKAIIQYTEENYKYLPSPDHILISNGAKQSLFNILYSILNPTDEVVILAPYWVSYPEMVKMAYAVPVVVTPENGTFHPTLDEIKVTITNHTRAIILNNPNNPSGVVYSKEFVSSLIEFCEHQRIYLIMDDIYHKIIYDGYTWYPPYQFTRKDIDTSMIIVVNGISKIFGMTGFRIGWTIASKKLTRIMTNVQTQITSGASSVLQSAAEGALLGMQSNVENLRLLFQNNRKIIMEELHSFNHIKIKPPGGAFYCLPDFRYYSTDSKKLSNYLLEKCLVVTVPGIEFGMEGHLRLSFAGSASVIKKGIDRIKWALDPLSPNEIYIGDRKYIRDWL